VPNDLLECFDKDGPFDVDLFMPYRRKQRGDGVDVWEERLKGCLKLAKEEMEADKKRASRTKLAHEGKPSNVPQ
jgi:hypothetical protein